MRRHIRQVHMQLKNFPCLVCGQRFFQNAMRNRHMLTRHPNHVHTCPFCGRPYAYREDLEKHIGYKHEPNVAVAKGMAGDTGQEDT